MIGYTKVSFSNEWTARSIVFLVLVAACSVAHGEERAAPSEVPEVHLYTMGVGEALFERFGHAAMCLHFSRRPSADWCYNYGTADFQTPLPLSWAFLRGRADFWVATTTPSLLMAHYRALDRTVWRQRLPLIDDQALEVAQMLRRDARPENRHFTYHHFDDNCTTRLRGIVDVATEGALNADSEVPMDFSYRDAVRRGFSEERAILVASDLFLGRNADRAPTLWQAMFLPRVLRDEVRSRFDAEPVVVYERWGRAIDTRDPGSASRGWLVLFGILFMLPIVASWWTGRYERVAVALASVPLGVIGLVLWTIAILSPLPELRWNEALLVFVPLDLALAFVPTRWRLWYARARSIALVSGAVLLATGVLLQPLWLPLLAVLAPYVAMSLPRSGSDRGLKIRG